VACVPLPKPGTSVPRTPSLAARRPPMQDGSNDGEAVDLGPVLLFSSAMHHGSASPSAVAEADAGMGANGGAKRRRGDHGCAADGGARGAGQECVLFAGGSGLSTCLGPSPRPVVRPIQVEFWLCLIRVSCWLVHVVWALDVSGRMASGPCKGAVYAALAAHPRGREVCVLHVVVACT